MADFDWNRRPTSVEYALWEQNGAAYGLLFPATLSAIRVCRLRVYQLIDRILAGSERAEIAYDRRMFIRHGRYFTMAFVAHSLSTVIGRSDPMLTGEDETLISQQTNALSELIYSVSKPQQGYKGYLSIFRNLTSPTPCLTGW